MFAAASVPSQEEKVILRNKMFIAGVHCDQEGRTRSIQPWTFLVIAQQFTFKIKIVWVVNLCI